MSTLSEPREAEVVLNIVFATESPLKKEAIQGAFVAVKEKLAAALITRGDIRFQFVGANAKSGVNSQPIGWEETITGANNRASNALSLVTLETPARAVIAIENGIVYLSVDGVGYNMDISWVVLNDLETGKRYVANSTGIPFPSGAIQTARELGLDSTTVGEVLSAFDDSISSTDPHSSLLGGVLGRVQLMEQAVKACFGQWIVALRNAREEKARDVVPTTSTTTPASRVPAGFFSGWT